MLGGDLSIYISVMFLDDDTVLMLSELKNSNQGNNFCPLWLFFQIFFNLGQIVDRDRKDSGCQPYYPTSLNCVRSEIELTSHPLVSLPTCDI